jgi:hypothetical protein
LAGARSWRPCDWCALTANPKPASRQTTGTTARQPDAVAGRRTSARRIASRTAAPLPGIGVYANAVPKSKVRKKPDAPVRTASAIRTPVKVAAPSPAWYPIVMAVVLVLGLAYLVVYYLAGDKVAVMKDIGAWNFAVGFGVMLVGLIMAVRWR